MKMQKDVMSLMEKGGFSSEEARTLYFLRDGPKTEKQIQDKLGMSQWNVTKTLKSLYFKKLISEDIDVYSLNVDLDKILNKDGIDLSKSESRLVDALKQFGEGEWVKSVELTKKLGITQATISESARRLKKLGFIESGQEGYRLVKEVS